MIGAKRSLAAFAGCSLALAGAAFVPAPARSTSASDPAHWTSTQYSAWYELIPDTATTLTLPVKPGDHFHADIHENATPGNWTIALTNLPQAKAFTKPVTSSPTYATAEWIEEAPTVV